MAAAVLLLFSLSASFTLTAFNKRAASNRNSAIAEAVVKDYIDQALTLTYSSTTTPTLLAITAAGSDRNGDGDGDGVLFTNVPLLMKRSSASAPIISTDIYRRVTWADTNLNVLRVSFMAEYVYSKQTNRYQLSTLRSRDK